MGVWIKRGIIAVVVLALAAGAMALARRGGAKKDKDTYVFGDVTRGEVRDSVSATGVVTPFKTVDIKPDVGGKVTALYVDLGSYVHKGQRIADIDPTDTQAAQTQAQAQVDQARSKQMEAGVSVVQQREQAHAQVASAERAVANARAKMIEAKIALNAQPGLTDAAIAQAQAALVAAQRSEDQAKQSKQQLTEQLGTMQQVTIPLNIETVNTTVNQAKANVQTQLADYHRKQQLLGSGFVAQSDVDTSFAQLANMRANLRQIQQRQKTLQQENTLAVNQLKAQIDAAEGHIQEAAANVNAAQAQLKTARQNAFQNDAKKQEYAAAQAQVRQSQADLKVARANLKMISQKEQEVRQAAEQTKYNSAALHQAVINSGYTHVVAPRDGIIITKNVEMGTVVPSSKASFGATTAMFQLGAVSPLWIVCNVDETDIAHIKLHQKVRVTLDAYPDSPVTGFVWRIDPQATLVQQVTMIPVTVQLDHPDMRFKPQMNATCEFIAREAKNAVLVPNDALRGTPGNYKVQEVQPGTGTVVDVPIKTGVAGQDETQVLSGLNEGDKVITKIIHPQKEDVNNPFGSPFGAPKKKGGFKKGGKKGG